MKNGTDKYINQSEFVDELARLMGLDASGTTGAEVKKGIEDYLNRTGNGCNNESGLKVTLVKHNPPTTKLNYSRWKKELKDNKEDVIWGYKGVCNHWITAASFNNTVQTDTNGNKYHEVDFMCPTFGHDTARMYLNGTLYRPNCAGRWRFPDEIITVSKKKDDSYFNGWNYIDKVTDPADGWLTKWETSNVPNGYYNIRATAVDEDGHQEYMTINIKVENPNNAPSIPTINGPTKGKTGISHTYSFLSTDPEGDEITYYVEWGDGDTDIVGPSPSGIATSEGHKWTSQNTFKIRAKAQDPHGAQSDWGELVVTMPKPKPLINTMPWFQRFLQTHPQLLQILRILLQ
jgi:hypothetical protein